MLVPEPLTPVAVDDVLVPTAVLVLLLLAVMEVVVLVPVVVLVVVPVVVVEDEVPPPPQPAKTKMASALMALEPWLDKFVLLRRIKNFLIQMVITWHVTSKYPHEDVEENYISVIQLLSLIKHV